VLQGLPSAQATSVASRPGHLMQPVPNVLADFCQNKWLHHQMLWPAKHGNAGLLPEEPKMTGPRILESGGCGSRDASGSGVR
jgi:hypothetical protein